MPELRQKRVPDRVARAVLTKLQRSGELDLLIGMLRDHEDYLTEGLKKSLAAVVSGDPKELATLQALQGALGEVGKIASAWQTIATSVEPAADAGDGLGRRLADPLTRKRARARL